MSTEQTPTPAELSILTGFADSDPVIDSGSSDEIRAIFNELMILRPNLHTAIKRYNQLLLQAAIDELEVLQAADTANGDETQYIVTHKVLNGIIMWASIVSGGLQAQQNETIENT